jgi:hypothetical protein
MVRLIDRVERDRLLAAANLTPADAGLFDLARRIVAHVRAQGADGVDLSDAGERAALVAAVGVADLDQLVKATRLATEAGTLVALP